jgi:hypothetical protein
MFGANYFGAPYFGQSYAAELGLDVPVTGVAGTGAVGTVSFDGAVAVSGVSATGNVGSVTLLATLAITGVSGTGAVGMVIVYEPQVFVTGVHAYGFVGRVSVMLGRARAAAGDAGTPMGDTAPAPAPMILGGLRGKIAMHADGHTQSMRLRHGSILTPGATS